MTKTLSAVLFLAFATGAFAQSCQSQPELCRLWTGAEFTEAITTLAATRLGVEASAIRVDVLDYTRAPLPADRLDLQLPERLPSTDGIVVIHGSAHGVTERPVPVWTRARIAVQRHAPVALEDIAARAPIAERQFEYRDTWAPFDTASHSDASPAGAKSRRAIRAGEPILASLLEFPYEIERGQAVELHVRAGAAHLRLNAVALQSARRGESVALRLSPKDPTLNAIVSGPGTAQLNTQSGAPGEQPAWR